MGNKELTQQEKEAFKKIEAAYLIINKAKGVYEKIFKNRSEIDKILDKETGFQQKKSQQLGRIMQAYLPTIIENKKIVGADWGPDQKILDGLNKMFANIN